MFKKLFGWNKKEEKIEEKIEDDVIILEEIKTKDSENNSDIYAENLNELEFENHETYSNAENSESAEKTLINENLEKIDEIIISEDSNKMLEKEDISDEKLDENIIENSFEVVDEKIEYQDQKKKGFFERLKEGLFKTRDAMNSAIDNLINGKAKIDDELYDELEEILISADLGVETTVKVIDELRDVIASKHIREPKLIKGELETLLRENLKLKNKDNKLFLEDGKQSIVLVIGVNGVGKTTTIGKLAHSLQNEGKSVMLAAADTFRAAAIEQLTEWSRRVNVDIVSHSEGSDPASVVFDAIKSQKANNKDVLIIDTAGRLHNKVNLMNELEKINRIIDREHPEALKETLLVLDATTGQNAIFQAKEFNKVTNITGIILTKLDGTAKGGVVFPLQSEHNIPVKYIGIGEQKDNLEKFDSEKFVDALFDRN